MGYRILLFLLSFYLCQHVFSSLSPRSYTKDESLALMKLKQTLVVHDSSTSSICDYYGQQSYGKTSSWNLSTNCCLWDGVKCDALTGHVIELDLGCSSLVGKIDSNSTLFQLSHLQRLNLSGNGFLSSHISPKFGKFSSLTHLDLSYSYFSGQIPSEISHLSKLHSLILSSFRGLKLGPLSFKLLLRNLTQLRELDLTGVHISSIIPQNFSSHITTLCLDETNLYGILPESIFHLHNLEVLSLVNNQLNGYFPKTKWNSSASIMELELSGVNFSSNLPESLGYLTSLIYLSLGYCNLMGPIPKSLWDLTHIESLRLENNHLEGPIPLFTSGLQNVKKLLLSDNSMNGAIPSWIFSLPSLSYLNLGSNHFFGQLEDFKYNSLIAISLRNNKLQGYLPKSIWNLVNLTTLDLSLNNFSGKIDASFFSNLNQLSHLNLSYNSISLINENKVKSTLPESLTQLALSLCEVDELDLLRSAKKLRSLDLSNNKIQGRIPDWAWSNWMFSVSFLNLSHNMLTSFDQIPLLPLYSVDLRSNSIQGSLPMLPPSVNIFFMSNNNLSGEIPSSICTLTSLRILDLARNNLKGEIPQCLGNMSDQLEFLDMQHNSLSGDFQTTFGIGSGLKSFNLHGNKLEGKIPRSLANCKQLEVLDLGNNHLNDTFPMWLGILPKLRVLSLRSNRLHGPIRTSRSTKLFPKLQMLDLSCNSFTAEIPTSLLQNLKAMRRIDQTVKAPSDEYYEDSVTLVTKGLELEVVRILSLYTIVDLSRNKFEGCIPSMMGDLIALRVLNLSHNGLQGHIPKSLGKLSVVESLDLSFNQLSGEIPETLASLTSLAVLNLSRNHLEGCIPGGPQFATFQNNSYEGNDGLRGFPVSGDCGSSWRPESDSTTGVLDQESNSTFLSELSWKVVLMGYGSGLFIGFSIAYFMLSSRNLNWLSRIAENLEYIIIVRRRKKQQSQRRYRRRNNVV